MSIITAKLLSMVKKQYRINWLGLHGVIHFSHVYDNGIKLAEQRGVNSRVVQLFLIFHDSQRRNEGRDPNHGTRGGQLAVKLREFLPLYDDEVELLVTACSLHTSTLNHENITVQACMDADRLQLGRVGIMPDPERLCTPLAKLDETINWAYRNSLKHELPSAPFGFDGSES